MSKPPSLGYWLPLRFIASLGWAKVKKNCQGTWTLNRKLAELETCLLGDGDVLFEDGLDGGHLDQSGFIQTEINAKIYIVTRPSRQVHIGRNDLSLKYF